ncbi:MAG: lactonase family protein [Bacteroidaceae bacterium]|nr:lactonase family protein [Bacteroidaceae bacterium]MBQ9884784.1 lactonase family protein [Bacteroidaceae bacterium]
MRGKLLYTVLLGLGLAACQPTSHVPDELNMLVGTYTGKGSEGIYTFRFDQANGTATPLDSAKVTNPSYVIPSADGTLVYAVTETSDSTAALNSYRFDKVTGKLAYINTQLTFGEDPCYIGSNGKIAVTANYTGGSMTVFPIASDGSLQPADTVFCGTIGGPDLNRQDSPHVHCTYFSPDGKYIFATDFSADRIIRYDLSNNAVRPTESEVVTTLNADYGPRHIEFSADGTHAYVVGELSDDITVMDYADGSLTPKQVISGSDAGGRGGADIHLSPNGKFLYASHRLKEDGISIFSVAADGTLTKVGYQPTGIHPRNFNITPNGKYLLCACRDSDVIQVYEINPQTGLLKDTKQDIHVSQVVCVKFVE